MNCSAYLLLAFALPLGACAVSGADPSRSEVAQNTCQQNSDCPSGGICNASEKICQGSGGQLTSLLVAVSPPPTLVGVSSFTYFTNWPSDGTVLGSSSGRQDIEIPPAVSVDGGVHATTSDGCVQAWLDPQLGSFTPADGSMPASVTFTPSQRADGVPTDSYSTGPVGVDDKNHHRIGYAFQQALPAGEYDVYIKPAYPLVSPLDTVQGCQAPPRLLLHQTAQNFDFKLPAPSALTINVTWPLAAQYVEGAEQSDVFLANPLSGWTLDLVDQSSGRVLSTVQKLDAPMSPPMVGDKKVTYQKTLVYAPVYAPGDKGEPEPVNVGSEIIRLTPPANDVRFEPASVPYTAPTILVQLDGALVDADGKPAPAQIVQDVTLPTPVTVQFQTGLGDSTPVPAGVLITAEEIDGITGLSTSFSRTIQVGADGTASVDLLPGKYRVIASPQSGCADHSCLGLVETEWVVRATPPSQSGKYIEFDQAQSYEGSVNITGGAAAAGATVHAVASALFTDSNVLNVGDATVAVVPRATSGLVDSNAAFSFQADAGLFDLRVEPDPSTGYGWLVDPGFELPARAEDLGSLEIQLPIVYRGTLSFAGSDGSSTPIPKALIRAYVYVKDGAITRAGDGGVAIQVAETYSDDQSGDAGAFRLLIPKTLDLR